MMKASPNCSFLKTVIRYSTRLVCLGALAWFGLIAANVVVNARSSFAGLDETTTNEPKVSNRISELLTPGIGYWSFDQTDLSVQRVRCSEQELDRHLEVLQAIEGSISTSSRDVSHLVALAESNGAIRSDCVAGSAWRFDNPELRLCLIASDAETPFLRGAAFAMRAGEEAWDLTIFKPQPSRADHLLPLPAGSQTTCSRRNENGELQMELVSTTLSNEQLLAGWRSEGWDVQHTPWGSAASFSYLCVRGDDVVYAWSDDAADSNTLMLTSATGGQEIGIGAESMTTE